MTAISTTDLGQRLRKAERRGHLWAYALIAPLFLFVALSFLLPLGTVLLNSVYDPIIPDNLARTVRALDVWNGPRDQVPPEPVFAALALDLKDAMQEQKGGSIANRLNIEESGLRTIFMRAARRINTQDTGPWVPFLKRRIPPGSSRSSGAPYVICPRRRILCFFFLRSIRAVCLTAR